MDVLFIFDFEKKGSHTSKGAG